MRTSVSLRPPPVLVEDHREHRIRRPADLLRCIACIIIVVVLGGLGIVASATTDGVEVNIVEVSKSVPQAVLEAARPLALFALLLLSVALATMPRPPSTTTPTTQARPRSRSAGLRIRCSR